MSLRFKALKVVEIALRVPPLFVIDELLKLGAGLPDLPRPVYYFDEFLKYPAVEETPSNVSTTDLVQDFGIYRYLLASFLRVLFSCLGCGIALCMFILNTKHLMVVYMYLTSVGVIFISYWANLGLINYLPNLPQNETSTIIENILKLELTSLTQNRYVYLIVENLILQCMLALIFVNIHLGPRHKITQKILPVSFIAPTLAFALQIPTAFLNRIPVFSALLPLALTTFVLWSSVICVIQTIYSGYTYARVYVSNFGMSALIETEWSRLNVPEVLRTFWLLRVIEHVVIFFSSGFWYEEDGLIPHYRLLKYLMITGCDTITSVLGITSHVSYICHHIGKFFQWILLLDDENDKNFGTVSAIVFYILALQTGLTSLEPEVRFVRLCRNFCLLFTALLHFIHNVVNPLLMSLSASHNPSLRRHVHALSVCLILILTPMTLMYFLWTTQETSTWLLAVTAFSVEVIVKVICTLAIYALFLIDSRRTTFWEKLDDYIYYIRSFGNTVEFCFGIFLFFNGAWILLFESGSAIRAIMMCIHAYFNIWCDAKAGWTVFMKRRTAVNKIESLPEANERQLQELDDVCAICYQEMRSAKITKCNHYFHGVCLRKWLYVQDRCPLCHSILHAIEIKQESSELLLENDVAYNR